MQFSIINSLFVLSSIILGISAAPGDVTVTETITSTVTGTLTVLSIEEIQTVDFVYTSDGSAVTTEIPVTNTIVSTISGSVLPATSGVVTASTSSTTSYITGTDGIATPVVLEYIINYYDGCTAPATP